jgi:hypothetical protein
MSSGRSTKSTTLEEWKQSFQINRNLPFITNSATISLDQLENFLKDVKQQCPEGVNGIRIEFVRFQAGGNSSGKLQGAGGGLSQVSLVLLPLKNYNASTGTGEISPLDSGEVYTLAFSDPQTTDPGDTTVLCPPKCG